MNILICDWWKHMRNHYSAHQFSTTSILCINSFRLLLWQSKSSFFTKEQSISSTSPWMFLQFNRWSCDSVSEHPARQNKVELCALFWFALHANVLDRIRATFLMENVSIVDRYLWLPKLLYSMSLIFDKDLDFSKSSLNMYDQQGFHLQRRGFFLRKY